MSSRLNLKKIANNLKLFVLNTKSDASQLPLNTTPSLLANDHPHIHFFIEVTNDCVNIVNKRTSTTFVVTCLLSSLKHLRLSCSQFQLSGLLMEKLKIAVNYTNSIRISTDIGVALLRRRLPQACFASQI